MRGARRGRYSATICVGRGSFAVVLWAGACEIKGVLIIFRVGMICFHGGMAGDGCVVYAQYIPCDVYMRIHIVLILPIYNTDGITDRATDGVSGRVLSESQAGSASVFCDATPYPLPDIVSVCMCD